MPDRSVIPAIKPFGDLSLPPLDSEILPNGLKFNSYNGGDQEVAFLTLAISGGESEIGGMEARLMLSAIMDGTDTISSKEMAEMSDFNGARIGVSSTPHFVTLNIAALNHRMPAVLECMAKAIANPAYPQKRLDTVREQLRANYLTSRREINIIADEAFEPLMLGQGHPLTKFINEERIDALSREGLLELHRRMFNPSHMTAFLGGLLDDELVDAVKKFLCSIPKLGEGCDIKLTPFVAAEPGLHRVPFKDSYQSAVMMGLPTIPRENPDYVYLRIAVQALGGYFGSRLMKTVREEQGLCYGINATLMGYADGSYIKITANCDHRFVDQLIDETRRQMRLLVTNLPSGEELQRIKLHYMSNLSKVLDTPLAVCYYYYQQLINCGEDHYYRRQIETIKAVTPEDIARMAEKYLNPDNLRIVVASEEEKEEKEQA